MKIIYLLLLVLGSNMAFGQMQFLGFDHNYCPDALSMNYTYSNWFNQLTEQGGFKVYRDGVEVYSGSASLPYTPTCVDLKFVNDGVGFMVLRTPLEHHRIYRTEVLAIYLSKKLGATVGDIMLGINALIFSIAAYLMGVEIALYSLLTYLAASKALDFIVEGIEEYVGVTIVSDYCEEVRLVIIEKLNRGVTVYSGKKGYGKRGDTKNVDVLYSVITRLEINRMYTEVEKIDPNAFIVMHSVKDTKGGMIKQRSLKA